MNSAINITACVFDIQRMSLHDGPGIRTTVFLKGCNLRCFWCHNPESWTAKPDIQYFPLKCIGCFRCVPVCPLKLHSINNENKHIFNRRDCISCGKCAAACCAGSLVLTGQMMTCDDVMRTAKRDMLFYKKSGGGVTVSGGEPLLQPQFVARLLALLHKDGINTAIESALCVNSEALDTLVPETDFFLVDIKLINEERHKAATGVSNKIILENIRRLDDMAPRYCLRVPLISGVNDDKESIKAIAAFAGTLKNAAYIELMPYHKFGEAKYASLGMEKRTDLEVPSKEKLDELSSLFKDIIKVRYQAVSQE